jgi:anti-sigma factor RsiW
MSAGTPCADLIAFANGELAVERADAFRAHLPGCAACRAELPEAMELAARISAVGTEGSEP